MAGNKRLKDGLFMGRRRVAWAKIEGLEPRLCLSAGQFDPTFGTGGAAYGELFPGGQGNATALQSDGKIIAAGGAQGRTLFALARFNANGLLDRAFGVDGRVTTNVGGAAEAIEAVAVQKDGKIVAAGYSENAAGTSSSVVVARYLATGALDASFGVKGIATISLLGFDTPSSLVIQRNGEIDIAGKARKDNDSSPAEFALARLTAAGQLDSTFGIGGKVLTAFPATGGGIDSLLLQSNGDLIATGDTDNGESYPNTYYYATLVRYLPNGSLDPAFGSGGVVNSSAVPAVGSGGDILGVGAFPTPVAAALQANGKIDIATAGNVIRQYYSATDTLYVERFNTDGSPDMTFGNVGLSSYTPSNDSMTTSPNTVMIQKNGDIVIAGTNDVGTPNTAGFNWFAFVRFNSAGALGSVTLTPMVGLDDGGYASAAVQQPDQRIVIVGAAVIGGYGGDFALARYTLAGILDSSFGYHGTVQQPDGITGEINSIAVQADGKILIAGSEQSPDPAAQPTDAALARYNANGTLDTSFGVDGRMYLRIGANAAWNSVKVQSNGDIVVGGYGQVNGMNEFALVRYLPSGLADQSFGVGGETLTAWAVHTSGQVVNSLAIQKNGDIVAVGAEDDAGNEGAGTTGVSFAVARYRPNGSLDKSFGPGGEEIISVFVFNSTKQIDASASSVVILANNDILLGGTAGNNFDVYELTPSGVPGGSFHLASPYGTSFVDGAATLTSLAVDPTTGDIVAGGYVTLATSGLTEYAVARYTPTGQLDPTFGVGGELTVDATGYDEIQSLAIQPDGKIVTGGIGLGLPVNSASSVRPFLTPPPTINATVARFTSKGLDPTFGQSGLVLLDGGVEGGLTSGVVTLQPDGKILAGDMDLYQLLGK